MTLVSTPISGDIPLSPLRDQPSSTVSEADLLARVRAVIAARRANGAIVPLPQALLLFDESELEGLAFYPWRRMIGFRTDIRVKDLLKAPAEVFVARCYRVLLLRDPTDEEARWGKKMLTHVGGRLAVLARLRWSAEGRQAAVPLRTVGPRLVPVLGPSSARLARSIFRKRP